MQPEYFQEQTLSSLQPGSHLCCIYEDEQQHRDILVRFISDGLALGQKVLYIYEEHTPEHILGCLRAAGVAHEAALTSGQLVLSPGSARLYPQGRFDPQARLADFRELTRQAAAEGYPALRWTAEMAAFGACADTGPLSGVERLAEFEALQNQLAVEAGCLILCQYHRRCFDPNLLMDVLLTHPKVVVGGYVYDNFYYLPPDAYLRQERAEARFDVWLNHLTQRHQMEWQLEHTRRELAQRVDLQLAHLAEANQQLSAEIRQRSGMEDALVQANAALRQTEIRYQSIFDAANDAILILSPEGRLLEANQAAFERFGYPREALVGMTIDQLVAPEYQTLALERVRAVTLNDEGLTIETIHRARDGRLIPTEVNAHRIQYENGWAVLSVSRDITQRKRAEDELRKSEAHLRESETKFRSLIENSPDGITLTDENGRIVEFNPGCERLFNIPAAQALGRSPTDIYFDVIPDPAMATTQLYELSEQRLKQVRTTGQGSWLGTLREYEILRPDGGQRFIQSISFPIPTERGFMMGTVDRDITEHHRAEKELEQYGQHLESMVQQRTAELQQRSAELQQRTAELLQRSAELLQRSTELQHQIAERQKIEAALMAANQALEAANAGLRESETHLRESEARYRALVNQSPAAIMVVQDERYVFVNPSGAQRLGYPTDELVGMPALEVVSPESADIIHERMMQTAQGQPTEPTVLKFIHKNGSLLYSEITSTPILYGGRPAELVIAQDVTERMRYEQTLEASLAEKEVILREIHHRVKNNLNVIIALIDLQKAAQTDPNVLQVFKELQTRAYTMALVHESLYRSPNLARIDFAGYLRTLIGHLYAAYGPAIGDMKSHPVQVRVDAEDVALKIETAIPCGLIVNELVTNALKYAFPTSAPCSDPQGCEIVIGLRRLGFNRLILTVSDNGVGLPAGQDWRRGSSLGLQLIQVLAHQLEGEIELDDAHGLKWIITFSERRL